MAVTVNRFLKSYPEFKRTSYSLIQQKMNQAVLRTGTDAWGDLHDEGVMLMTAHLLSVSPEGEKTRLHKYTAETIYLNELKKLRIEVTAGLGRNT